MDNREIDALVAEKVMGLITGPIVEIIGGKAVNAAGDSVILPDYSGDISFAWQVVLKVCEETRWYELTFRPTGAVANFLGNTIHRGIVPFKDAGNDRTRAQCMAICLAALRAVGIEVPVNGAHH